MPQHVDNVAGTTTAAPPAVVIFGSGACARKIAVNLADRGLDVCLAMQDELTGDPVPAGVVECLAGSELDSCRGFAGNFQLRLRHRQGVVLKSASAIVVAEDCRHAPNHAAYGFAPGPRVMDISTLEAMLERPDADHPLRGPATVALLCGWSSDAHPTVGMRMLHACSLLQARGGVRTYFMTGNLKVAADGAERRVAEAKRAGAIFLKFTDRFPSIVSGADNRFVIDYVDELTRTPFRMEADWMIVDETVGPNHRLAGVAKRLGIHGDGIGFAQADNVRRMSNMTNRRGIFVAGGGRGIQSIDAQLADADQVCLAVTTFLRGADRETLPPAIIQNGRCARCLTCHRLCPHGAVEIGARITIVPEACQRCGICAAGCPAQAIEMEGVPVDADIRRSLENASTYAGHSLDGPRIMVFGCSRSAGQAMELVRLTGRRVREGVRFVEVPCGGSTAGHHLLAAFEGGADGVMLCVCHTDNCQSQSGNRIAGRRSAVVQELLTASGLERQRLRVVPIAANMGNELAASIEAFAAEIAGLAVT